MSAELSIPPKVEAVAQRARIAAAQRVHPAVGHAPPGSRGCAACGLPVTRSQLRCLSCLRLREVADGLAARSSLLASRPDGRALAERMVVVALLLDLDRYPVEQLATVELIEGALSAEVAELRFALSRVSRRRLTVAREPFGHLIAPHLRAAARAIVAPHDLRAAEARMDRRLDPGAPPDRVETLRARLSSWGAPAEARAPAAPQSVSDTTGHGSPGSAARIAPTPGQVPRRTAETTTIPHPQPTSTRRR